MADIFISYSRKDSEQTLLLAGKLHASGIAVWIDQQGIEGAASWSQKIVEEIDRCGVFLLLLSSHSAESPNVIKEVSIAYESERKIIIIDIEPVPIPSSLRYQLAGIQRTPLSDEPAIYRALEKAGIKVFAPAPAKSQAKTAAQDSRKSLIVLPFEDLSPGSDNAWFADGLTSELIDSLTQIKSLRLVDRKTSMGFKGFRGKTKDIASEYGIRYFIEGSVRKFQDQIKISVSLLDIQEGEYLWQESHRGVFADIFDIQELVAQKVVEGLRLHLTKEETAKAIDRGTENAQAYEFFIRGAEYFNRQTRDGYSMAVQLYGDAIREDSNYANAYKSKANALASLYRTYDRNPEYLVEAQALIARALVLKPDLWSAYQPLSHIYQLQGKLEEAERTAKTYISMAPDEHMAHFALGFFYFNTGQSAKAVAPYEEAYRLAPSHLAGAWNLIAACDAVQDRAKCALYAKQALPYFERHLKLHPSDEGMRVSHASLLFDAGRIEEARIAARALINLKDGTSLFNTASLLLMLGDVELGFETFGKSIEAGYRNINALKSWLAEDGMNEFKGTPHYDKVRELVENIVG